MEVFARLRFHSLKLHQNKCNFYFDQVGNLGHKIYLSRLEVVARKVVVVISILRPKDVNRL